MDADAEEGILAPDEATVDEDDENVTTIGDGRYVISANEDTPNTLTEVPDEFREETEHTEPDTTTQPEFEKAYGLDLDAQIDGERNTLFTESNDITETFSDLLEWYASQVSEDVPVNEVLEVLLSESRIDIQPETTEKHE